MSSSTLPYLYFPAPLLGESSLKLQVLLETESCLALAKPSGLLACASAHFPQYPNIEKALQLKFSQDTAHALSLKKNVFRSIFPIDPDYTACALFSKDPEQIQHYRNAYGSNLFSFTFKLVVEANTLADELECTLPIFNDSSPQPASISHKYGKKASTRFQRLERLSPHYELWQAQTTYLRPYQIRLHAKASGLRVVGETLLDAVPLVCLSNLKRRKYKGTEKPLYPSIAIHLSSLQISPTETIHIPLPKAFQVMMDKICEYANGTARPLKKAHSSPEDA